MFREFEATFKNGASKVNAGILPQSERNRFAVENATIQNKSNTLRENSPSNNDACSVAEGIKKSETFQRVSRPRGSGYSVTEISADCLEKLVDFPDLPLRTGSHTIVKAGRSATLARVELSINGKNTPVAYKIVRRLGWLKKVTGLPRQNRTLRTWQLGHQFLKCGIATPRPILAIVPPRLAVNQPSIIALEWLQDALNVDAFVKQTSQLEDRIQINQLAAAARSLGEQLGRMHNNGFSHRDLKPGNMMLTTVGNNVQAHVIDLDGVDCHKSLTLQTKLKNLSRLMVGMQSVKGMSATVCLRFLKSYLQHNGETASQWKPIWRQLTQLTLEKSAQRKKRKKAA